MKKVLLVTACLIAVGVGCYKVGNTSSKSDGTQKVHEVAYKYDHQLYSDLQNELTKGSSYYDCQYIMTAFDLDHSQTNEIENKLLECYDKNSEFNKELRGAIDYWSSDGDVKEAAEKMKDNQFPNNDDVTVGKLEEILKYAKNN